MNLSDNSADFTTSRAFNDEAGYNPTRNSFSSVMVRVAGTFSGGFALTALLAVLAHH